MTRRQFASRAVLGAAAASITAEAPAQQAAAPAKVAADLQLELLRTHYPDHLTDEHLAILRQKLERQQLRSKLLSAFPLKNADEPAIAYSAYRGQG